MKVWIINHYAVPPSQAGITRHFSLAQELLKLGHEVTIFASSFDHLTRTQMHLRGGERWRSEDYAGIRFVWIRTPSYSGNSPRRFWNMIAFARAFPRVARKFGGGRPDVVMGSSPHLFAPFAAERWARREGIPFVLEVRDLWPQSLVDIGNISQSHPVIRVMAWMERELYRRSNGIACLLPGAAEYIEARGAPKNSVVWLPNGIEDDLLREPLSPTLKQEFVITYAGAHGTANGLDTVLDAAALLQRSSGQPKVKFVLIGDGPEKKRLMERAARNKLNNVEFKDSVPKHLIHGELAKADAFLMILKSSPVFQHGISPNKLFDYFGAARPVLFGVNTAYNPVAEAGAGFTFDPSEPSTLAKAVLELVTLPADTRALMSKAGRRYVERYHLYSEIAKKLDALLRSTASLE